MFSLDKKRAWETAQNRISYAYPVLLLLLLAFLAIGWMFFWPSTDPARYQCYALTFWRGSDAIHLLPEQQCFFLKARISQSQPPLHMLPLEYPPLTLLPFSLPLLLPGWLYQAGIALIMAVTIFSSYHLLHRYGPVRSAPFFAAALGLSALPLMLMRYDILPAFCTLLCIVWAERKRWLLAYAALAIGVLLKLYPILLLPVLFIAEQQVRQSLSTVTPQRTLTGPKKLLYEILHWHWGGLLLFLALVGGITALFALCDMHGAIISQIEYFSNRPLQVEAIGSSIAWITHFLGFSWQGAIYSFGSINIVSESTKSITTAGTICLVVGTLLVLWLQWQRHMNLVQAMIALLLLFVATGKVFSPQYLIWFLPLLAYSGAYTRPWLYLWGTISLLTSIIYIGFYSRFPDPTIAHTITLLPGFMEVVTLRNLLFVVLTVAYIAGWWGLRAQVTSSLAQVPEAKPEEHLAG